MFCLIFNIISGGSQLCEKQVGLEKNVWLSSIRRGAPPCGEREDDDLKGLTGMDLELQPVEYLSSR